MTKQFITDGMWFGSTRSEEHQTLPLGILRGLVVSACWPNGTPFFMPREAEAKLLLQSQPVFHAYQLAR
jgi:hypothetical protein